MIALNVLAVLLLLAIFYQDCKERLVHSFLFPLTAVLLAILHYFQVEKADFYTGIAGNLIFVTLLLGILFLYTKLKLKMSFVNGSFGLGDLLFFYTLAVAFPSLTFGILFIFSLFFSLAVHLGVKHKMKNKTVPLAGYMALFFAIVLVTNLVKPLYLYLL